MKKLAFIPILLLLFQQCRKDSTIPGDKVAIYRLKSYQLVPNKCQVDNSTDILADTALISNDEIINYSKKTYQYKLTVSAIDKLKALADGTPFAVTVDNNVIYYGILKPSYSSSTCFHSITMDYVMPDNTIILRIGYPGSGENVDDQRNNALLLATLREQGKLR